MLMPSIFGEDLFDEIFDDPFFHTPDLVFGKREKNLLKTDVREKDGNYELVMDLPGYKKEDVKAQLENGYLTITASRGVNKDETDNEGNYIRRERYSGQCSRSFYVGENLKQEDIKAKFQDGILQLTFPKEDQRKVIPQKDNYIAIEG